MYRIDVTSTFAYSDFYNSHNYPYEVTIYIMCLRNNENILTIR